MKSEFICWVFDILPRERLLAHRVNFLMNIKYQATKAILNGGVEPSHTSTPSKASYAKAIGRFQFGEPTLQTFPGNSAGSTESVSALQKCDKCCGSREELRFMVD